jgi:RNA polymerase sigma factor (sigma-70 family)
LVPLYTRYAPELSRFVKRTYGVDQSDTQDIVHQTFLRFAAVTCGEHILNVRAYLFQTARNIVVDERRRRLTNCNAVASLVIRKPMVVDERTPERVLMAQERLKILRRVILASPEARRRSFLLHRLEGLSCAEIARLTGYSESAIKKHVALAASELESAVSLAEQSS